MREVRHIGLDPESTENSRRSRIGSAVAQPEINLFSSEIFDRLDIWASQHMKVLIIEPCHVLEVVLNARKRRVAPDLVENVGLQDGKIDAASEHHILSILQCPSPGDRQKPQVCLSAGESERQIDGVVGTFGYNTDESEIYLVAHGVT